MKLVKQYVDDPDYQPARAVTQRTTEDVRETVSHPIRRRGR